MDNSLGWEEDPPDGDIIRARTKLGQLRIWYFPRSGVSQVNGKDFAGPIAHPGLYILVNTQDKISYIGESSDLRKRLNEHNKTPPRELPEWTDVYVVGDGRGYYQSILTETTMRLYLEKTLIKLIEKGGIMEAVNKVKEEPKMSASSQTIGQKLEGELQFVLMKLGLVKHVQIIKVLTDLIPEERLLNLLASKEYQATETKRDQIIVNGQPFFKRPGTKPRKTESGWHITLRTKPRDILYQGKGALVISRGRGYILEAKKLKEWLKDDLWPIKPGKEAIDIYADLEKEQLYYHTDYPPLDLKPYRLSE